MVFARLASWLIALTLWVFIPVIFIQLSRIFVLPKYDFGALRLFGGLLVIIGIGAALISILEFKHIGEGTPVPVRPPKKLVVVGLYRYTRNPIYLAMLTIFFGWFMLLGHLSLFVLFIVGAVIVHLYVIFIEEPILVKRFGKKYVNYTKTVPRWL